MAEQVIDASVAIKWVVKYEPFRNKALQLLRDARLIYDSVYAALAELRCCEFWTADRDFYGAVRQTLSFVKYLPNYS